MNDRCGSKRCERECRAVGVARRRLPRLQTSRRREPRPAQPCGARARARSRPHRAQRSQLGLRSASSAGRAYRSPFESTISSPHWAKRFSRSSPRSNDGLKVTFTRSTPLETPTITEPARKRGRAPGTRNQWFAGLFAERRLTRRHRVDARQPLRCHIWGCRGA